MGRGLRQGEIWDPLITFERKELSASNLVQRWRMDPACIDSAQCLRLVERFFYYYFTADVIGRPIHPTAAHIAK